LGHIILGSLQNEGIKGTQMVSCSVAVKCGSSKSLLLYANAFLSGEKALQM